MLILALKFFNGNVDIPSRFYQVCKTEPLWVQNVIQLKVPLYNATSFIPFHSCGVFRAKSNIEDEAFFENS